ncbi:MAG: glycerate kinase [Cyanobacteria bacterium SZAS-4]|nr:glycerate kinase [Cyanobacteria bacterium SZAS-4]
MRFLVSPCAYKGSFSALQVAYAISAGIRSTMASAEISMAPIADGGDGTLDAIYAGVGGVFHDVEVRDAIGRPKVAKWLSLGDAAIVELANSSGLAPLIVENKIDALKANTYGLGEVIRAALANKPKQLFICVGGSASTDGGSGLLMALGAKFLDADGNSIKLGGQGLIDTHSCDLTELKSFIKASGVESIKVAVDVTNPLLGKNGAAAVYGPQKGADKAAVAKLDKGLKQFAKVLESCVGRKCKDLSGAGAAGGTAFGISAAMGAEMISGFDWVASVVNLEKKVEECDVVITAEGYLDGQSIQGKAIGGLAKLCAKYDKQLWAVPGWADWSLDWEELGVHRIQDSLFTGNWFGGPTIQPGEYWADEASIQAAARTLCQKISYDLPRDNWMQALLDDLIANGYAAEDERPMMACSEEDISELEQRFQVKLPRTYKEFLSTMGRGCGDFLTDSSWMYPLELALNGAKSLISEFETTFELLPTDFVFLYRDNFTLWFDTTDGGDDPPVFIFIESDPKPEKFFNSFSNWLTCVIEGEIRNRQERTRLEQKRAVRLWHRQNEQKTT